MGSSIRLTLFSFLFLVGFAFSMWIGYLVYRFGPKNNTNRYFILTMLSVSLYLFSAFVVYNLPLGLEAMAWERIGFVGAIMVPAFFLHFMLYFPERNELSGRAKIVMFTVTIYMLFLIVLVPGNRLLVDIHEKNFFRYCSVGNLYFLYLIYLVAVNFCAIAYATWKYFHLNDPTSKRRIGLVLLAATVAILGSFVETRPLIGNNFVPVTSITTSAMSLIIGYAIVRYGAFDVERLVQEGIFISLGTASASVLYILFIFILTQTFLTKVGLSTMAISSSFVVVMILAFQPFKESVDNFIQRRFFGNVNHYRGVIEQLSQNMTHNLNLVDLSNIIVQTLRDNIGLTQAFVSIYKPENELNQIISSTNKSLVNTVFHRNDDKFVTEENLVGKRIYWENLDVKKTGTKNSFYSKLDGEKILTFPLQAKHKLIGYLGLGLKVNNQKFYDSERRLLVALAHQAAIAVDNAQLYRTMVIQKNKLDLLMRQLDNAYDIERNRISRELHDKVAQNLAGIILSIDYIKSICQSKNKECSSELDLICNEVKRTIEQMRDIIFQLRIKGQEEINLSNEIKDLLESFSEENNIIVSVSIVEELDFIDRTEKRILLRIIKEVLYNIKKHAKANNVSFEISFENDFLKISITDNGVGFEPGHIFRDHHKLKTYGLISIRENINEMNGKLLIESKPGVGTRIDILFEKEKLATSEARK